MYGKVMYGKVMGSISMNFMPMILYTVKVLLVCFSFTYQD